MTVKEEIQSYKQLLDDGVIELEEYVKMKDSAFSKISASESGINVLRELKELLDMGAITEDEYNSQKSLVLDNELQSKKTKTKAKRTTQAANMDAQSVSPGKKKLAFIATAVLVVIALVIILSRGGGNHELPGGAHFEDSYDQVMEAALSLNPAIEPTETTNGIYAFDADLYGIKLTVVYNVTKDKPLYEVSVSPGSTVYADEFEIVKSELTKQYGKPTSSNVNADGDEEVVWKFKDLVITAKDLQVTFRKPD